jgi:hypothetical protein
MSGFGSPNRRRLAILFVLIGAVAAAATFDKDYPREQPVVFRLPDTRPATLTASFTKVGEAEASTGFTLNLPERALRDVNHKIRVPNGDYIVTIELRRPGPSAAAPDALPPPTRLPEETSVSERVILSGSEVVVSVPARATE